MKIPSKRFSWLEYFLKENSILRLVHFLFGTLFLHTRAIGINLFERLDFDKSDLVLDIGCGDGNYANWISLKTSSL